MKKAVFFGVLFFFIFIDLVGAVVDFNELENNIYVCEGESFSKVFSFGNSGNLDFDISPRDKFFMRRVSSNESGNFFEIFSKEFGKEDVGNNEREIFVTNGSYVESKKINFEVVEMNNPPKLRDIKSETVDLNKENYFHKEFFAEDLEDGDFTDGKLKFELRFVGGKNLFNVEGSFVNSSVEDWEKGVYEVEVCVEDSGLGEISENSVYCDEDGKVKRSCKVFQLNVVKNNAEPTIKNQHPEDREIKKKQGNEISFGVSAFDPDGISPNVYWYVDNELKQFGNEDFDFVFPCGGHTVHNVKAEISDGKLNDSFSWRVILEMGDCELEEDKSCEEKFVCDYWNVCQNLESSFERNVLSGEDYREIKGSCDSKSWDDEVCGFQFRECFDLNSCGGSFNKPAEIQECYFTLNPSCSDGIKNCHDGSCELLVDCGGPCSACATCSDGIQNQGEENVDCGGPCPTKCPTEVRSGNSKTLIWILGVIGAIGLGFVIFEIVKINKLRRELAGNVE